jgi:multidrug efflux pump subunit AcrA (membrane-fusion protein)
MNIESVTKRCAIAALAATLPSAAALAAQDPPAEPKDPPTAAPEAPAPEAQEAEAATPAATPSDARAIRVRTERPRVGPELSVSVQQPVNVAPYYQANLFPTATGTVDFLQKAIGHRVSKDEVVMRIKPLPGESVPAQQAEIRAPFDGVVASRAVDPGAFVTGALVLQGPTPVLTIVRTDIVTVGMRVPDTVAAMVGPETEAELRLEAVSGGPIRCRLSRIAPSLGTADRTRLVEVDLWNGTAAEFEAFRAASEKTNHADLKGGELPQVPVGLAPGASPGLLPGMYGQMRLVVKRFDRVPVVPSSAIVRRGGMPFLFAVEGGAARLRPVVVEIDDGTLASVRWVDKAADGTVTHRQLTTEELVVVSNQGELEDGSPIEAATGGK